MGITCDKDALAVKQSNYLSKIVNVYIVCDLDTWPRNPTNNFIFKTCLLRANSIVKNSGKEVYVYNVYMCIMATWNNIWWRRLMEFC